MNFVELIRLYQIKNNLSEIIPYISELMRIEALFTR